MKLVGAAARLAVAAVTMFATANGQPDCSAEQNACMADADCLAILTIAHPSCSGGSGSSSSCQLGMAEVMTLQPDGTEAMELQPDGTCVTYAIGSSGGSTPFVDAACVYTAPADGEEMMIALYANTLGSAYMTCTNPIEPCPYDASRSDSMAVYMACANDAACAALIPEDQTQAALDATTW